MNSLPINLSFLITKPTGHTNYAVNLLPHLLPLDPTLLISPLAPLPNPLLSRDEETREQGFRRERQPNGDKGELGTRGEFDQLPITNYQLPIQNPKSKIQNLATSYNRYPVPANLTPEQGTKGHLRRLIWTQVQLPRIYQELRSRLLFSPLPEAPLYTNCRYIVTVHDLIPLRFPRLSPLTPYHRYYIPQVLAQAQHIICNSNATADDIIDFFQIPARKITPILLAYDANCFRPLSDRDKIVSCPYFLYIGRHDPHKNVQRIVAAFAAMAGCQECELWLAGSPDRRYTPKLQAQAQELGIADRVKFLDYVPDSQLPTLLQNAIALVFPSLWEGFGLPVLEAMACGTPTITSNLSSLPEVAGDAALLVNAYSVEEIAAAMQAIVSDAQLRSHLSRVGIARANQFSWQKTGLATYEVLKRFL